MGAHGKIVEKAEVTITPKKSLTNSNKADDSSSVPPASGKDKDKTTAEAVIVKIWTPSSKLLNLGKIRKVQRKTNTVIRRKKLRFTEKKLPAFTAEQIWLVKRLRKSWRRTRGWEMMMTGRTRCLSRKYLLQVSLLS